MTLWRFYAHDMSNTTATQQGAPKKESRKIKPSITMDKATWEKATKLAFDENISLSAFIERLVRAKTEGSAQ